MENYCRHLKEIPLNEDYVRERILCKITNQSCVGEIENKVNFQPSHYSPEDAYYYADRIARKKCPAYNLHKDLVEKISLFRKNGEYQREMTEGDLFNILQERASEYRVIVNDSLKKIPI